MKQKGIVRTAVLALLLVLVMLDGYGIGSDVLANAANIQFVRQVVISEQMDSKGLAYYLLLPQIDVTGASLAQSFLEKALSLDPRNSSARWDLGRVYLFTGSAQSASHLLPTEDDRLSQNPILFFETLVAHSRALDHTGVVALYEASDPPELSGLNGIANDILALAHLNLARISLGTGNDTHAREELLKALCYRAGDLYANYHLMRIEEMSGDHTQASVRHKLLTQIPESSLRFADDRLADFAAEAISELRSELIWDKAFAFNIAADTVWQAPSMTGTERLLSRLAELYPTEPEWHYLLGELFERRGLLENAYSEYLRVLKVSPSYAGASLRLGLICESLIRLQRLDCSWRMARDFFATTYEANPDDMLALTKLIEVDEQIGPLKPQLHTKYREISDERLVVAEQLKLPSSLIELGPNLLKNNGFEEEQDGHVVNWLPQRTDLRSAYDRLLFHAGPDRLESFTGAQSMRIGIIWIGDDLSKLRPHAGIWYWDYARNTARPILTQPGVKYLLGLSYRTEFAEDNAVAVLLFSGYPIRISNHISTGRVFEMSSLNGEHFLPSTRGAWRRVLLVGPITSEDSEDKDNETKDVTLLLRLWGPGQVWFDDVEFKQIIVH